VLAVARRVTRRRRWSCFAILFWTQLFCFIIGVLDGAAAHTICITIENGRLTRRSAVVGDQDRAVIMEDTRFR
jgi:hypothetical protein